MLKVHCGLRYWAIDPHHTRVAKVSISITSRAICAVEAQCHCDLRTSVSALDDDIDLVKLESLDLYANGLGSVKPRHFFSRLERIEWFSKLTGGFAEPYTFGERVKEWFVGRERDFDIIHDNQTIADGVLELQTRGLPLVTTIHHPITRDYRVALASEPKWYMRLLIHRMAQLSEDAKAGSTAVEVSSNCLECLCHGYCNRFWRYARGDISDAFGGGYRNVSPASGDNSRAVSAYDHCICGRTLKGLSHLLKALAALRPDYPDIRLTLVGRPKPDGETQRLINALGLADCIDCCKGISHEEMVEKYARATVAVVPSMYEGFGLPAVEAMACGVPLVSTSGGALAEVVADAALVVSPGDGNALAQQIKRLFDDASLRDEYASRGFSGLNSILLGALR